MSDKQKKPQKLRARLPRGLGDRNATEIAATRRMTEVIREVYERYGFEPVETPAMEFTDALGKFLPDQDRPNEGVFSFQDDDEQWISLRYDLTAPLARYVAENWDALPKPYRSYRAGYVFRNEKPGPGRFRQFMQFDADTVGSASPAADAEMCMMAADAMEALGIPRGQYVVKVNNRKVLDGVMESIGVTEQQKLTVLRAIDKHDRLGDEGVRLLLTNGRKDDSGDFTKGAGLSISQADRIMLYVNSISDLLNLADITNVSDEARQDLNRPHLGEVLPQADGRVLYRSNLSTLRSLQANFGGHANTEVGIRELTDIVNVCRAPEKGTKFGYDRIRIDPSVVRGLEYYTGAVFEVELLLEAKDDKGRPVRFGSVGGGGRYDGLVSRFRGEPVPATGFSIGVSRLQAALELINKDKPKPMAYGPVVVTVFDRDRVADYQKMVAELRNANIRAELYLGNPKNMGNQLKYADKRNSPCVIIQGSDELNHPSAVPHVIIKDLIVGSEVALFHSVTDSELTTQDFRLDQKAQAQHLIPVSEMVSKVRNLLEKHDVKWG